jgi:uncharacterized membrane protein
MKFINKYIYFISTGILLIDLAIIIFTFHFLPKTIPIHFNYNYIPNEYGSKNYIFLLWGIHFLMISLLNLVCFFFARKQLAIFFIAVCITLAQSFMILIDTIRTIDIGINTKSRINFALIEYFIIAATLFIIIFFFLKNKSNAV